MNTTVAAAITFSVNGQSVEYVGPGGRRLIDVLREDLGLGGTKEGCGEGECGACSVLLDGDLVASCLVPVCQAEGREVVTVEGLGIGSGGRADTLQTAFLEAGAVQCGFCTPGMLLAGRAFLESHAEPTDTAIRSAISGNLCRCTGYGRIVEAIRLASQERDTDARMSPLGSRRSSPRSASVPGARIAAAGGRQVETPRSLHQALELLAARGCRPIAGGTDVMVALAPSGPEANAIGDGRTLVDLSRLSDLRGIAIDGDALVVGALTTYLQLRRSLLVQEHLPVLAQAAALVGAVQVQSRGTIGGNIVTASPAGDMLPVLLATDASLVLASTRGERTVPVAAFFTGYRATALAGDELLLRVRIPLAPGREVRFRKVGTRRAQAISKVVLAVSWRLDGPVRRDVRVAVGSVADRPIRCGRTESLLEGEALSRERAERAAETFVAEIRPIDDIRSTAAYRRAVAGRILVRLLHGDPGGEPA